MITKQEMEDEVSRIMELREQGLNAEKIGKRLFMSAETVRRRVRKAGISEQFYGGCPRNKLEKNRDDIRNMLESGTPYAEICAKYGVAESTVRYWRETLDIPPRKCGGSNSLHLDIGELERLWNEGKGFTEIGRIVGAAGSTVRMNLARAGIVSATGNIIQRAFPDDPEEIEKLRDLLSGGLKNAEIAEKFGVSIATVSRWRKKLGINDMGHGRRRRW